MRGAYPLLGLTSNWPQWATPSCSAKHREIVIPDGKLSETQEHVVQRLVKFWAYGIPIFWHRIDIKE